MKSIPHLVQICTRLIDWFQSIPDKHLHTFTAFDIKSLINKYPQPSIADYRPYHLTKKHSTRPLYNKALKSSGFNENIHCCKKNTTTTSERNRKRNIICFNLPYSKNVQTNVAKTFLNLIEIHFPPNHNLHSVFNKNNVNVTYSCMPDMGSITKNHNKKILNTTTPQNGYNCRKKTNVR